MKHKLKTGIRMLCVPLLLLLVSCAQKNDVTVLKLGHALDTGHAVHKGMVYMGSACSSTPMEK